MAELFGIAGSTTLTSTHRAQFAAMSRAFPDRLPGATQLLEYPWVLCGTIALHDNDPPAIASPDCKDVQCIWLGNLPRSREHRAPWELLSSLRKNDLRRLCDVDPPFAVCLADVVRRELWLVSDPCGLYPLYYSLNDDLLVFGTKFLPLRHAVPRWELDREAVVDFFVYEHVTGNRTYARDVRLLPPRTMLRFSNGQAVLSSYGQSDFQRRPTPRCIAEAARTLYDELQIAVERALLAGHRAAVPLSGGLDSRALLGCALRHCSEVRAYTFGRPESLDIAYASRIARICSVPHTVIRVAALDFEKWLTNGIAVTGGMVNCIHYHILSLSGILGAEADVVLDGLGGDALTGAHLRWSMLYGRHLEDVVDLVYRMRATGFPTLAARCDLFESDFLRGLDYDPKSAIRNYFDGLDRRSPWIGCHRFDIEERQRRFIQYGPHLLRGFTQVQTPFYAPGVRRLLLDLPPTWLLEQRAYVHMHSRYLTDLARVPDTLRSVPLTWPWAARFGKKVFDFLGRRLVPQTMRKLRPDLRSPIDYAAWFRNDLRGFLFEHLMASPSTLDGIIRRTTIQRLLNEHFSCDADHTVRLASLLTFAKYLSFGSASKPAISGEFGAK